MGKKDGSFRRYCQGERGSGGRRLDFWCFSEGSDIKEEDKMFREQWGWHSFGPRSDHGIDFLEVRKYRIQGLN